MYLDRPIHCLHQICLELYYYRSIVYNNVNTRRCGTLSMHSRIHSPPPTIILEHHPDTYQYVTNK